MSKRMMQKKETFADWLTAIGFGVIFGYLLFIGV
jgi:hypothetical protein